MFWQSYFPTKVLFGVDIIKQQYAALRGMGSRALIVIGQGGSARRNGSMQDICQALQQLAISWEVFDQVEANPHLGTARQGAAMARACGAEFIIGIGGGSPMDVAKVIAILAQNELNDEELFGLQFEKALPVVAIPTTAGTGSEVTPYSILTYPAIESKKNIASPLIIPQLAFLDPQYTMELPSRITVDTAVDAYSHALEGFLAKRATPLSDVLAREALHILGLELKNLALANQLTLQNRELMLYGSWLAGMVISVTGTSVPHALGYSYTYFQGVTHGRANGLIMPAYMEFNYRKSSHPRIRQAIELSGFTDLHEFRNLMQQLCGPGPQLSPEEKNRFVNQALAAKNLPNNIVVPDREDMIIIVDSVC